MSDDRPSVYVEGDRVIYRASAVGGCLRSLVACRLGYAPLPFDDASELRMAEGNLHEPAVINHLENDGWVIVDQQREVELVIGDRIVIRGHIDGAGGRGPSAPARVVEVKAMGQDPYNEWLARGFDGNQRYGTQLSVYMAALGLPGLMVAKNRNTGYVHVTEVDEPPVPVATIKARVARIEAIARTGELPDCDVASLWGCPFRYLHDQKDLDSVTTVDDQEVDALAAAYDHARTLATQADAMKKTARDHLAEVVRARGKVRTGRWSVSCAMEKKTRVDLNKLRAEIDVSPYEIASEVETVRVSEVKR